MARAKMAPDFDLEDCYGNSVTLSQFRGRLVLLVFAGQATEEASARTANRIGHQLFVNESVDMLTIVNLPRLLRVFAMGLLRKAHRRAVKGARKQFEGDGVAAPADLEDRIRFLCDWNGRLTREFGFDPDVKEVHLAIIGPDSRVRSTFSGADPESLADKASAKAARWVPD